MRRRKYANEGPDVKYELVPRFKSVNSQDSPLPIFLKFPIEFYRDVDSINSNKM